MVERAQHHIQYCLFITSHLLTCTRIVLRRISRGNKNFHERTCVALHDTKLTTRGKPTLDLLYQVWTIHAKLPMCGSRENPQE